MEVQVMYGLACVVSTVGDNTEAAVEILGLCDRGNGLKALADQNGILGSNFTGRVDMLLGDDKNMGGSLRCYVTEGIDILVLIDLGGGDIPCDYLTKEAVFHI